MRLFKQKIIMQKQNRTMKKYIPLRNNIPMAEIRMLPITTILTKVVTTTMPTRHGFADFTVRMRAGDITTPIIRIYIGIITIRVRGV